MRRGVLLSFCWIHVLGCDGARLSDTTTEPVPLFMHELQASPGCYVDSEPPSDAPGSMAEQMQQYKKIKAEYDSEIAKLLSSEELALLKEYEQIMEANPQIEALKETILELTGSLLSASVDYTRENPEYIAIEKQLNNAKENFKKEAKKTFFLMLNIFRAKSLITRSIQGKKTNSARATPSILGTNCEVYQMMVKPKKQHPRLLLHR